ncbi:hypothetical protein HK097_000321, partial [Rhizophlyctis rosea]
KKKGVEGEKRKAPEPRSPLKIYEHGVLEGSGWTEGTGGANGSGGKSKVRLVLKIGGVGAGAVDLSVGKRKGDDEDLVTAPMPVRLSQVEGLGDGGEGSSSKRVRFA